MAYCNATAPATPTNSPQEASRSRSCSRSFTSAPRGSAGQQPFPPPTRSRTPSQQQTRSRLSQRRQGDPGNSRPAGRRVTLPSQMLMLAYDSSCENQTVWLSLHVETGHQLLAIVKIDVAAEGDTTDLEPVGFRGGQAKNIQHDGAENGGAEGPGLA